MVRNKVQPYIEPTTEIVDVVANKTTVSKRGLKKIFRGLEGSKYGSIRTPKRSTPKGVEM